MSNQRALSGSAHAQQNSPGNQADLFLFDLKNEACEHGLKTGEYWNLRIATENEIINLKKEHHPVVSIRLQTHDLLRVYLQVKGKLQQSINDTDRTLTEADLARDEKKHLVAFPVRNVRN